MKNVNILASFKNAGHGFVYAFKEKNFKIHLAAAALALSAGLILRVGAGRLALVLTAIFFVLCFELTNTAIEAAVDLCCGDTFHPLAKAAKDAAAAAVLLASVFAAGAGAYVFFPAVWRLIFNG
ncbi:MAG: diacylglycerol kinase family protein [Defluviitaleaceae bacterium]|nr:diacylglycerol kinase family protein [Defluviitaleaceae bacterium]